jgi:hypothetical protein
VPLNLNIPGKSITKLNPKEGRGKQKGCLDISQRAHLENTAFIDLKYDINPIAQRWGFL